MFNGTACIFYPDKLMALFKVINILYNSLKFAIILSQSGVKNVQPHVLAYIIGNNFVCISHSTGYKSLIMMYKVVVFLYHLFFNMLMFHEETFILL